MNGGGREFVFVLSATADDVEAASRKAADALGKVQDTTTALDHAHGKAAQSSESLLASLTKVGVGAFGLKKVADVAMSAAEALVQAQINSDRLNMQLSAAAGASKAGQELDYVRQVSNSLGLELNTTATSYARFLAAARGTSLEGRGVREVFDSVAKSAAVMGLNVEETQGVLRALEQMLSKGTVQAEELRGQLGDRMPGALQIAARALGVTTGKLSEMVEKGQVIATDFLPAFARQLDKEVAGGADKAADTMQAATNRMSNSWELLKQSVTNSGIGDFIKGQINVLADATNHVSDRMKVAKEEGGGFFSQIGSGTWAVMQFLNPFNALSYTARDAGEQLKQAKEHVAALKAELAGPGMGNIFLRGDIARLEEFIAKMEQAQSMVSAPKYVNLFEGDVTRQQQAEEATGRRRDALGKVTAELTKKNDKLVTSIKALTEAWQDPAIGLAESDYRRLVGMAYKEFGPKAEPKREEPPVDHFILDKFDAQAKLRQAAYEKDTRAREFMLGKVQASDERAMQLDERRLQQGVQFAQRLVEQTETSYANQIPDAEARSHALLAIERARLTSQLQLIGLDATKRALAQDEIDRYMVAREAELTEQLKPEWQKRLEAWQDTARLMKDTHATIMQGIVDEGERAWVEWGRTGKLNVKGMVNFFGDELAKLAYRQAIAPALAQGTNWLLNLIGIAGSGATGGGGGSMYSLPTTGVKFGGITGGGATGTNELERDMITLVHKGEAIVPKPFNPWANGGSGSMGGQGVTQNITYNVPPGMTPAAFATALEANNRRLKGEVTSDMLRPGRPLQRAAALSRI